MSVDPSEENWQPPWWKVWKHISFDKSKLTDTKSVVIGLGKKNEVIIGKIVSGGPKIDDPRYTRDKVTGKSRKIWGIMFKRWF